MALLTDDCDLNESYLMVYSSGNGDWYVQIIDVDENGQRHSSCVRVSTSGGHAPSEVKIAVAQLWQAMEKHNLNENP